MNTGEALLSLAIPFAYAIMFFMAFLMAFCQTTPALALCSVAALFVSLAVHVWRHLDYTEARTDL